MLTRPDGTQFSWDYEGRLAQAVLPNGGGTVTFHYDPFGKRIQKSGPLGTTNYFYDGSNILEAADQSGNVLARYADIGELDQPLAETASGALAYYEQDGVGTVTSLTDANGNPLNTYAYDSYGNLTASTTGITNPLQYTGREFDQETGIYYYHARYYDQTVGRFTGEDPLQFQAGTNFHPAANFYAYVGNHPTSLTDPSGLCPNCFAQLKYRPVQDPRAQIIGATHSFWYLQGSSGQQYIISGYPQGSEPYLNVGWNTNIYNGVDNVHSATWWDSGVSAANCEAVDDMIDEAMSWPENTIPYSPGGPNSNSAANDIGSSGGFNVPRPPGAVGWSTPVF